MPHPALKEGFRELLDDETFPIGASIGVVPITDTSGDTADLLRAADAACYAAKEAGGSRVQVGEAANGAVQVAGTGGSSA